MTSIRQNFFHPDHPIDGEPIKGGFNETNFYSQERNGLGTLKVKYTDIPGNPLAPVALLLHGYRGQPDGPNNKIIANIFRNHGIATAQVGFSGVDTYSQHFAKAAADLGTVPSFVEDVKILIDVIPEDRPIVLMANSASINVAVPAANDRVSHILAVSPVPNITTLLRRGIDAFGLKMPDGGHLIHPQDAKVKVTDKFLKAGQPIDLLCESNLSTVEHKPTIVTVRSEDDIALSSYGASDFVSTWIELSARVGYQIFDNPHPGTEHGVDPLAEASISEQAGLIARDLGVPER